MYRGTTPTLTFRLPIDTGSITVLSLAVAQAGQVKIEKHCRMYSWTGMLSPAH